jgi:hypothetical protein
MITLAHYMLVGSIAGLIVLVYMFLHERQTVGPRDDFIDVVFSALFGVVFPALLVAALWPLAIPVIVIAFLLRVMA